MYVCVQLCMYVCTSHSKDTEVVFDVCFLFCFSCAWWVVRLSNWPIPLTSFLSPWILKWPARQQCLAVEWSTWSLPCWDGNRSWSLGLALSRQTLLMRTRTSSENCILEWCLVVSTSSGKEALRCDYYVKQQKLKLLREKKYPINLPPTYQKKISNYFVPGYNYDQFLIERIALSNMVKLSNDARIRLNIVEQCDYIWWNFLLFYISSYFIVVDFTQINIGFNKMHAAVGYWHRFILWSIYIVNNYRSCPQLMTLTWPDPSWTCMSPSWMSSKMHRSLVRCLKIK